MTDPGWHPDPFGRAGRRYHDGRRWTEHVADDAGVRSIDPPDPEPASLTDIVIGAPPPRPRPPSTPQDDAPRAPRLRKDPRGDAAPGDAAPPPVPTGRTDAGGDATTVMPADVAAAAAAAASAAAVTGPIPSPEAGGADRTTVIPVLGPEAVAAASSGGALRVPNDPRGVPGPAGPAGPPAGAAPVPAAAPRTRALSPVALALALVGLLLALLGVLVLAWDGGASDGYLDLRSTVDALGPPLGAVPTSLVVSGGLFTLVSGGVVAVARAVGGRVLAGIAATVVVVAFVGLTVLGVAAVSVEAADLGLATTPTTVPADQQPGSPVTDPVTGQPPTVPGGAAVTDPLTGQAPTIPDQGQGAADVADEEAALVEEAIEDAERNLIGGAIVGFATMFLATVLVGVGLLRRPRGSALMCLAGLGLLAGWCVLGAVQLGGDGGVPDLGPGPWALAAGAVLMALSTVVPRPGGRTAG